MADEYLQPLKRAATFATPSRSSRPPSSSLVERQLSQRPSSGHNRSQSPRGRADNRRPSLLSLHSIDEVTQSFSDDILNPTTSKARSRRDGDHVTHWHSTPLAFAILPAIGGVLFKNGSAFITDILLLGLAAIFMNWSVRLPWDWYYSAQLQLQAAEPDSEEILNDAATDETAVDSASSAGNSPKQSAVHSADSKPGTTTQVDQHREAAAAELRRQEMLALVAIFAFPACAACLLHAIRGQLSSSSTALVSDFNLTIFVLAAEIRPFQQLIRLISSRTLHLQRIVTGTNDPHGTVAEKSMTMTNLKARVEELEEKLADQIATQPSVTIGQKAELGEIVAAEFKKRCEPRLEALERAMRRYEKRSTTLNLLIEQRLNAHESRIQDSLSLAAVAAKQASSRGVVGTAIASVTSLLSVPFRFAESLVLWPFRTANAVYATLKGYLMGSAALKPARRSGTGSAGNREEKTKERAPSRKMVR